MVEHRLGCVLGCVLGCSGIAPGGRASRHYRSAVTGSRGSPNRFSAAIDDLEDLGLVRYPALPLMRRAFELRDNVTAYDAVHVVLAERLDCPLVTADRRPAAAVTCSVEVLAT